MSEPTGRVRGRARGRGRSTQQEPARRPGQPEAPKMAAPVPTVTTLPTTATYPTPAAAAAYPTPVGGDMPLSGAGRTITRGGIRGDRPGGGDGLSSRMRGLQIGPQGEMSQLISMKDHKKQGEAGRPITLYSNQVMLKSLPQFLIYQYYVTFSPELESGQLRKAMVKDHRPYLGETYIYDGMSLYTNRKLEHDDHDVFSERRSDQVKIRINIKLCSTFAPTDPQCLSIINLLIRKIFYEQKYTLLGRNFYNSKDAVVIPHHKVEIWPGYVTATHQYQSNVMMSIDLSHKILRTNTALDEMNAVGSSQRGDIKDACIKALVGGIVLTRYNNRNYRIEDIDWDVKPTDCFDYKGNQISFVDYFKQNYGAAIRELNQPLLVIRHKKREIRGGAPSKAYLVPELCVMTGLTERMRSDFNTMKEIAVHTRVNPEGRVEQIKKFIRQLNSSDVTTASLRNWGLRFDDDLVQLKARQLDPEKIWQSGSKCYSYRPDNADWTTSLRESPLKSPIGLSNWLFIYGQRDSKLAEDFARTLAQVGGPMGMQVQRPQVFEVANDQAYTYMNAIKQNCHDAQIVVCLCPNNRKDRYDLIKKLCCVELGVPSQVIVARSLTKNMRSVTTKIAIQINCKLGGEVWGVEIPFREHVMIVGIDSYHDSQKKGRSVGGLVASMNPDCTKYHTRVAFQSTHQELLDNLHVLFTGALKHYHQVNGNVPSRIIVYRDGVGDGQLPMVQEYEVPQIRSTFKVFGQEYNPKLTYIVVNKRINTRFFLAQGNRLMNPLPGTVIDDVVTRPDRYDFFIVPQSVRQGTVTPTQFNVVYDDRGPKADHIQRLSYKMTHLYYNWSGTVRVPAPCQYAHKVAFLIGQCVHEKPSERLADTLFYL